MALIDTSYFFGELIIAQKSDSAVSSSLVLLIDELEPALLTDLMGYELKKLYDAGITGTVQKYIDIRDGKEYTTRAGILTKWKGLKFTEGTAKKSLIANYVYWHWLKDQATVTTGTGEKVAANQNAVNTSPAVKMTRAWNQMVDWNWQLIEFLLSHPNEYPEFSTHYPRILKSLLRYQNQFGI